MVLVLRRSNARVSLQIRSSAPDAIRPGQSDETTMSGYRSAVAQFHIYLGAIPAEAAAQLAKWRQGISTGNLLLKGLCQI